MREIGDALRLLFQKLSEFLDVFDLSFLISGATAFLALVYAMVSAVGFALPENLTEAGTFVAGLVILLVCYVSGLLCFALGRFLRRTLQAASAPWYRRDASAFEDQRLDPVVRGHGLETDPRFATYFAGRTQASRYLYVRMWAELRHDPRREGSLTLLNRYWKLAAAYDGLTAASLLWCVVLVTTALSENVMTEAPLPAPVAYGFASLTLLGLGACIMEAKRYDQYQLEELAATMAAEPPEDSLDSRWDPRVPLPPLASLLREPRV